MINQVYGSGGAVHWSSPMPLGATIQTIEETDMDKQKETKMVGQVFLWLMLAAIMILVLAGCTGQKERQAHRDGQVKIIETQVDARTQQTIADSQARIALYEAMARVAQSSPDNADAIAVALAVSSAREEDDQGDAPLVQLQRQENEAIELAKVIAPAMINTLGTVGVAALQADVNKAQSNNAARVAIADSASDADIMRSVTSMAQIGLSQASTQVGGDYYVSDQIDQSVTSSVSSVSSETTQDSYNNTETNSATSQDSYNTETNSTTTQDSYNNTETNSTNNQDSYNTETSSTTTQDSYNTDTSSSTTQDSYNNTETSSTTTQDTYNTETVSTIQEYYQTSTGDSITFEELRDLVLQGLNFTIIIDGEEVEVTPADCPNGEPGLTFGAGSVVCG